MGLTDILKSERGLFALALVIASTVLTALGHMSIDMWKDFNLYIFGIYATTKTATGVVGLFTAAKRGADASTPAAPAPAAAPALAAEPALAPASTAETK